MVDLDFHECSQHSHCVQLVTVINFNSHPTDLLYHGGITTYPTVCKKLPRIRMLRMHRMKSVYFLASDS